MVQIPIVKTEMTGSQAKQLIVCAKINRAKLIKAVSENVVKHRVCIRLPEQLVKEIEEIAHVCNCNMSDVFQEILKTETRKKNE
jgi:hypothetical protein